jgi:drug/metabolite transporter (DMT)-like permease
MNKRALRADVLLLITAGLWGFGFVAQSSGMDYVGPFTYNGLRFPLGALSLLPLIAYMKAAGRLAVPAGTSKLAQFRMTLLAGMILFAAVGLQQIGIIFTTVGNAGFITGFYVVLTPVLGIFAGKKTGVPTWIGMVFALAGLYFIFIAGNLTSTPGDRIIINPGDLITVASAFFWAVHILVIDSLVHKTDPLILSAGQFAWCGLFCIIAAFAAEPFMGNLAAVLAPDDAIQQWTTLGELVGLAPGGGSAAASVSVIRSAAVPVLYGGLCSVGIAYTLQVVAQKDAPPAHATIILCLEGTFAAFGGMLLRDEKPGPFTLLGFVSMLCAMFITQWDVIRPSEKNR